MMKKLLLLLFCLTFVCGMLFSSNGDFTVVIDAGHGGRDPGALRGEIKEKDINLAVATELGRLIEKNMSDVKVVYTRKTDVFVELEKRSQIANKAKANLFISVHTNSTAAVTTRASGADTYILGLARSAENLAVAKRENAVIKLEQDYTTKYEGFDPDSPESYIIFEFMTNQYMQQSLDVASYIQKDFKSEAKRVDRGVRQAGFLVLRESSMPSILIELGFINNPTEAKYLASPLGQRTMASAIYSGFKKYKEDFDKRGGGTRQISPVQQPRAVAQPKSPVQQNIEPVQVAADADGMEYRVQFLYSMVKLPNNSPKFKGLTPSGYTDDNGYKYTYGSTTNYNEIMTMLGEAKRYFSDAFVIRVPSGSGSAVAAPKQTDASTPTHAVDTPQTVSAAGDIPAGAIEYRIQFLYSPSKLSDNSPRYQGLEDVSYYQDGGYKYTVGSTTDYNEIRRLYATVKKKFSDSFIIRMKDGKRVN